MLLCYEFLVGWYKKICNFHTLSVKIRKYLSNMQFFFDEFSDPSPFNPQKLHVKSKNFPKHTKKFRSTPSHSALCLNHSYYSEITQIKLWKGKVPRNNRDILLPEIIITPKSFQCRSAYNIHRVIMEYASYYGKFWENSWRWQTW